MSDNSQGGDTPDISKTIQDAVSKATEPLTGKIGELESQLKQSAPKKEKPQRFTRQQLSAAVESERISQAEADAIWDRQQDEVLDERVDTKVTDIMNQTHLATTVNSKIDVYLEKIPDLKNKESDAFKKVQSEVVELMKIQGVTKPTLAHEYQALRTLYGPPEALQSVNTQSRDRETQQDFHTQGDAVNFKNEKGDVQFNQDGSVKGLPKDVHNYYKDLISKGIYSDWKSVADELKYADMDLVKRSAARG